MKKLNIPNQLTLLRVILVPIFMVFILYPVFESDTLTRVVAAAIYLATTLTDMADGIIARKYHLITNFGKFLDPLADKFMVFAAFVSLCSSEQYQMFQPVFTWITVIVIFRELAVTTIRLLVSNKSNVVIPASWYGKVKTFSQSIAVMVMILEPVILPSFIADKLILSWVSIGFMLVMTVASGINYIKAYMKYLDPND